MARFKLSDRARQKVARSKKTSTRRRRRRGGPKPGVVRKAARTSPGFTAGSSRRARVGASFWDHRLARRGVRAATTAPSRTPSMSRASPGISAGANRRAQVGKRVPPPTRPAGRYGGRAGAGYRYPGSGRVVRVGESLVEIGEAMCVPCSQRARAARG